MSLLRPPCRGPNQLRQRTSKKDGVEQSLLRAIDVPIRSNRGATTVVCIGSSLKEEARTSGKVVDL